MISRRKTWKDDLVPLVVATIAQFAILRFIDWAKANVETQPIAQSAAEYRYFYAPQIAALVIVALLFRALRNLLVEHGIRPTEWLKTSILTLLVGSAVVLFAHLDQIVALLARFVKAPGLAEASDQLGKARLYGVLERVSMLRFVLDLCGAGVVFLGAKLTKPKPPDLLAARAAYRAGDYSKAGELYLRVGAADEARKAFVKAKLPVRVAALELRAGNAGAAAALYEQAGDAFAWEAAKAWEANGDPGKARSAGERALAEAKASGRWDRLSEVAEALGDIGGLADACRKLAESAPAGPGRQAVWKRAAETARMAGRLVEAAEAYRLAGETLRAAELFLEGGRPLEALRDFEKAGDLARAASAASAGGQEKVAAELSGRDLEGKGDHLGAASAWARAGKWERAAALFERRGVADKAADAWKEAGKPDRAAPLYLKAGNLAEAAACFEAASQPEKAAPLYRDLGDLDKAATLFRAAGRWQEAAQALQERGEFEEAVSLFMRAGKGVDAARTALLAGQRERAWDLVSGVRRSDPGVPGLFLDLAEEHLRHGEPKDAVHVLRELLGYSPVEPRNVAAHEALARAYESAGDLAEAATRMAAIAEYDPAFREAGTRAARLALAKVKPPAPASGDPPAPFDQAVIQTAWRAAPGVSVGPRAGSGSFAPVPPVPPGSGAFPALSESPERRYEIVAELGRGGMGIVHKAHDTKLERWVALKILPAQLWGDETAMRYFAREAKAIAALSHPNVVALYDFGEGFGSAYLAMEYLEGPNLQSLIKTDAERVRRCWRDWFTQAARGVAAAHTKGILHRDLKPANLVLDTNGTLRILDFGLARPEADSGTTSKLIGTPAFFPPEVLRGEPPTAASDVYSLGATFYTLATGRWPYVGDDVLVARLERDPDDPRPFAPFLTEDEVWVLLKSLARHRPERYQDGGELLQALLSLEA